MQKDERPLKMALINGWKRICPKCQSGPLMPRYLKIQDRCPLCNEEFHHHRADDGPAYLTILLTGHLLAPFMLGIHETWRPSGLSMAIGFSIVFVSLSLYLLPRIKGALVSLQWAKRMHGFGKRDNADNT